jgi:anti-sigma factor RsiW
VSAPHPDVDELADLGEGLLTPSRTVEVEQHLVGCPDCTRLLAAVRSVPALLAAVPSPQMPPAAAARLEAVLDAEAARRTTEAEAPSTAPTPLAARRRAGSWGDRHPRLRLAAAAATTVAVLGGGLALGFQGKLSTGGTAETAASGSAEQMDSSVEEKGSAWRAESMPGRTALDAATLDALARRLEARQGEGAAEGLAPLTAAAAVVHGLRVGMAAS